MDYEQYRKNGYGHFEAMVTHLSDLRGKEEESRSLAAPLRSLSAEYQRQKEELEKRYRREKEKGIKALFDSMTSFSEDHFVGEWLAEKHTVAGTDSLTAPKDTSVSRIGRYHKRDGGPTDIYVLQDQRTWRSYNHGWPYDNRSNTLFAFSLAEDKISRLFLQELQRVIQEEGEKFGLNYHRTEVCGHTGMVPLRYSIFASQMANRESYGICGRLFNDPMNPSPWQIGQVEQLMVKLVSTKCGKEFH